MYDLELRSGTLFFMEGEPLEWVHDAFVEPEPDLTRAQALFWWSAKHPGLLTGIFVFVFLAWVTAFSVLYLLPLRTSALIEPSQAATSSVYTYTNQTPACRSATAALQDAMPAPSWSALLKVAEDYKRYCGVDSTDRLPSSFYVSLAARAPVNDAPSSQRCSTQLQALLRSPHYADVTLLSGALDQFARSCSLPPGEVLSVYLTELDAHLRSW